MLNSDYRLLATSFGISPTEIASGLSPLAKTEGYDGIASGLSPLATTKEEGSSQ
jgi:hypothetical protein